MTRIRAEAGAAYGVEADVWSFGGSAAHLRVAMAVDSARLADTLRVIRGHFSALADQGFDKGAVSQVRWRMAISQGLRHQTALEVALDTLEAVARGLPFDHAAGVRQDLAAVTPADLREAFRACHRTTYVSLVGDRATIEAALSRR